MAEEWRDVVGYEDTYQVSSFGQIRRKSGTHGTRAGRIVTLGRRRDGRLQIVLSRDNKQVHRRVHHVVCEAFFGPRPDGYETNHKDGNPTNNHIDNLEYVTRRANLDHQRDALRWRTHNRKCGAAALNAKLTDDAVRIIRSRRDKPASYFARLFGVSKNTVNTIRRGVAWRHVSAS